MFQGKLIVPTFEIAPAYRENRTAAGVRDNRRVTFAKVAIP
jgi:hypothetical protein